jgi:hypothetical protein
MDDGHAGEQVLHAKGLAHNVRVESRLQQERQGGPEGRVVVCEQDTGKVWIHLAFSLRLRGFLRTGLGSSLDLVNWLSEKSKKRDKKDPL